MYTASQIAQLFQIARETVRKYSLEFEAHFSPGANPGEGRTRVYSDADLEVFALIVEMKGQGKQYADVHASLLNGQRGRVPESAGALIPADVPKPTQLQARVNFLESQLAAAQESDQRNRAQIELLTRQLADAHEKIDKLNRQIGRLERDTD